MPGPGGGAVELERVPFDLRDCLESTLAMLPTGGGAGSDPRPRIMFSQCLHTYKKVVDHR